MFINRNVWLSCMITQRPKCKVVALAKREKLDAERGYVND